MFSEIRPNRGPKIRKLFHMTSKKQTVQGECFMNERLLNSLGHEDRSEWQRRKTLNASERLSEQGLIFPLEG